MKAFIVSGTLMCSWIASASGGQPADASAFVVAAENLALSSELLGEEIARDSGGSKDKVLRLQYAVLRNVMFVRASAPDPSAMDAASLAAICKAAQGFEKFHMDEVKERRLVELLQTYLMDEMQRIEPRIRELQRSLGGEGCQIGNSSVSSGH